jgi:nitronate monooxygenase
MTSWPDRRVLDLFGIELPIVQAPMAGATTVEMVVAVSEAGGLGSLPCATLSVEQASADLLTIRSRTKRPIGVNFFCHEEPPPDAARSPAWKARLAPYYRENGIDLDASAPAVSRRPFDGTACELVERHRPEVVSFHFGLPDEALLQRVKATGAKVLSSATTVAEAQYLANRGCDAIIAMGVEAGGHRGMFLADTSDVERQVGTFALVPQIADVVNVPVIAAGAVSDGRGIVAAFALGASAVQIGTAYLFCPEAEVSNAHREALRSAAADETVLTNVFSGRPARSIVNRLVREVGPMSPLAPAFPAATPALAPLRRTARGPRDFASLWSGQGAPLGREMPAFELTRWLADEAISVLGRLRAGPHS